jgi:hypothetical protein
VNLRTTVTVGLALLILGGAGPDLAALSQFGAVLALMCTAFAVMLSTTVANKIFMWVPSLLLASWLFRLADIYRHHPAVTFAAACLLVFVLLFALSRFAAATFGHMPKVTNATRRTRIARRTPVVEPTGNDPHLDALEAEPSVKPSETDDLGWFA